MKVYPFKFKVSLTYCLKGDELSIYQEYENLGKEDMPYTYGFHPYFVIDSTETSEVHLDSEGYRDLHVEEFTDSDFDKFILEMEETEGQRQFKGVKSPVYLYDKVNEKKVQINFDENFPYLTVWAKPDKGFICVEPWNTLQNAFNDNLDEVPVLKEGEKDKAFMSIKVD